MSLLFCMIFANFLNNGCLILFLHDVSDIGFMLAKMLSVTHFELSTAVTFTISLPPWFYFRNFVLPHLVWKYWLTQYPEEWQQYQNIIYCGASMLTALVFLQLYWSILFLNILYKFTKTGKTDDG